MIVYNVHTVLSNFQQHEKITQRQLIDRLKKCGLSFVTPQMLIDDGWLECHCEHNTAGIWNDDKYYTLTNKAFDELKY